MVEIASTENPGELVIKFGTLESAVDCIERLRGGAARRRDWDSIRWLLSELFVQTPSVFEEIIAEGAGFVRGRKMGDLPPPSKIADFGPPPPELCQSYGRCNKPGEPWFYFGVGVELVLSELDAGVGDRVAVLNFQPVRNLKSLRIGALDIYRRTSGFHADLPPGGRELIAEVGLDTRGARAHYIDSFISEYFSALGEEQVYKITSAASDLYYAHHPDLDCVRYDSVRHRRGACLAMPGKLFPALIQPVAALVIKVTSDLGYGIYQWEEEAFSDVFQNDQIVWQP